MSIYKPMSPAGNHRLLSNTYGEGVFIERICSDGFQSFKDGDFHVEDYWDFDRREEVSEGAELGGIT